MTQEHSDLKKEMEEHEESWKEQLESTQEKLKSTAADLANLKGMIQAMVSALLGK